jgi:D-amino peptidase
MRVFIIGDMEGVAGITTWKQVEGGHALHAAGSVLYTEEMNAAARGARAAGATEIVLMDCHGAGNGYQFNSLLPDLIDPDCEFVVQSEWTEYTGLLEQGCDAALLVGMHAMAGTGDGVMNHTVSGTGWREVRFNGRPVGEVGINAALCGTWGCPVLMVSGDEAVCRESASLLGDGLVTVPVKQGLGRFSARHKTPATARKLIEAAAQKAVGNLKAVAPYDPGRPCRIEVDLGSSDHHEHLRHSPNVEIVNARMIASQAEDWWTAWRQFYFSYRWPEE